jgi:fructose/tagatose bisphosphate aldolase
MFDGSHLAFADNVAMTRQAARLARLAHVSLEAEIGQVGGMEDSHLSGDDGRLTTVEEAAAFVAAVEVDALAVAVGNYHGPYARPPQIRLDLLEAISRQVNVPLALHGSSGIPLPTLIETARRGVKKINIGTELKEAWIVGARDGITNARELDDIRRHIRDRIRQRVLALEGAMNHAS